jgi:tetratricopeptide (TPR) repeat protein
MSSARIAIAAATLICVGGGRADAGDRELARQRYLTGTMLFQRGRYADALVELERGNQADPRPEFDYNIGLCLEKLGRALEAADAFDRFLAARPHDSEAQVLRADIARLRQSAAPVVTVTPPPPPLPPSPPPSPSPPSTATVGPQPYGAPTSLAQAFAPTPQQSFIHTTRGKATTALAVVGGALLVTSAVTGGIALGDRSAYRAGCAAGQCDDAGYDGGRRIAIATDVLLGIGAAAAVSAVIAGVARSHPRRTFAVAPSLAAHAGGVALAGSF